MRQSDKHTNYSTFAVHECTQVLLLSNMITDLVTLNKKLTSITEEAECLNRNTSIDSLHNDTELLCKTLGAMVSGAKLIEVLELLVIPCCLAYL